MTRTILHADLDAFYASVEVLDDPSIAGRPVIVGGHPHERGVVSAASYEARRLGVHSAMPLRTAARLCPEGVFVPGRPERYRELSRQVMRILASVTPMLEPISLDEAFLDVTASAAAFGTGEQIGRLLKERVRSEVGLTLSVGVATNKLCAKVASDLRKPDALVVVHLGHEAEFLAPLPVRRLWGVGPGAQRALAESGVATIGQLAALPPATLRRRLGVFGEQLGERARGIDDSPVASLGVPKSVGHEVTFDRDVTSRSAVDATLLALADDVAARLRDAGLSASAVQLKLRLEGFQTLTRQAPLGHQAREAEPLFEVARRLLQQAWPAERAVRLVGITAINLAPDQQLTLFDSGSGAERIARSVDAVRGKFGPDAITRARLVGAPRRRRFDFGERPRDPTGEA
ncbi:MAG: DNA polymerase IV [Candidatus Limnocylindria bacterium]